MSEQSIKLLAQSAVGRYNSRHGTNLVAHTRGMTVVDENTVFVDHGMTRAVVSRPRGKMFEVVSVSRR